MFRSFWQSMEFSRPEYWNGWPYPSPGDLPNSGIKLTSPALQADSLPAEPQGKPNNIGVRSLSLLQQIFPTQESNQGLLHYRWILYQLSYKGSLHLGIPNYSFENKKVSTFAIFWDLFSFSSSVFWWLCFMVLLYSTSILKKSFHF